MTPLSLATAVAAHLPRWSAQAHPDVDHFAYIAHPSGPRIVVMVDRYGRRGRVEFLGDGPTYRDGTRSWGMPRLAITCDMTRPPADLAVDLRRRLLIPYIEAFAVEREAVRKHEEDADEALLVARRLASMLAAEVSGDSHGRGTHRPGDVRRIYPGFANEAVDKIEVHPAWGSHEASVKLHLDVPPELAARVLAMIAEPVAETSAARVAPPESVERFAILGDEAGEETAEHRRALTA